MPKFNVHAYKVIRVRVSGVEAYSPEKACEWVDENLTDRGGRGATANMGVPSPAFVSNEEMDESRALCYLVDKQGDEDYQNSRWFWKDCKTPLVVTEVVTDLLGLLVNRLGEGIIDDVLRMNQARLPLLMGLDDGLDERIGKILKD